MKSLVFANHGIGDLVMGLPLLRALTGEPGDDCLVVTKSDTEAGLARLALGPKETWRPVSLASLGDRPAGRLVRLAREVRSHAPEASAMIYGIAARKVGLLSLWSGARRRAGPEEGPGAWMFNVPLPVLDPTSTSVHKVDWACEAARRLGRPGIPDIAIDVDERALRSVGTRYDLEGDRPLILLALGSGVVESHKRLSLPQARTLVGELATLGRVLLIGGPAEAEYNIEIAAAAPTVDNLTGQTSIGDVLALATLCDAAICTCNGISHLAAAARAPIIGLFGPTNPAHTGPYTPSLKVATRGLACSPCYRRGFIRGCGNPICMDLDVRRIVAAVETQLAQRPERGRSLPTD